MQYTLRCFAHWLWRQILTPKATMTHNKRSYQTEEHS